MTSLLMASMALALAAPVAAGPGGPYLAEPLADGVTLFRPRVPAADRANSLVIEQASGLVVIEAQPTPAAARELLAAIAGRYDRTVRLLVLSHPHAEAGGGASAFPDSTLVIASAGATEAMANAEHDFGAEVRGRSESWVAPPVRMPDIALLCRAELTDAQRPIVLSPIGPAHTRGDLTVALPEQDVLYVGGLLFADRNPYVRSGSVAGWISRLNDVIRRSPQWIVGLHGPPVDWEAVRQQRKALVWIQQRVMEAFADGVSEPQAVYRRVLAAEGIGARFAVDATPSFLPLLVDKLIDERRAHLRKRGLSP